MTEFEEKLYNIGKDSFAILDADIPITAYTAIDLSIDNTVLKQLDLAIPEVCQNYVDTVLKEDVAQVAYGGYLEKRNLYISYTSFQNEEEDPRNIHLGMDFWARAGTLVRTPVAGSVYGF